MKRDDKLILKILRYVRDNADGKKDIRAPDVDGFESCVVDYHVRLCVQAGFLELVKTFNDKPIEGRIRALTWQGHDHLDNNCDC